LVTLFDSGSHEGSPYIVMELIEGETLRERLVATPAFPVRRAVDYAIQIARGLAAAHDKGIIHRDLKPENVFITSDGRVKILDFGIAKLSATFDNDRTDARTAQHDTAPGTVVGTVGYMSPEQVRGRDVDHRSDLFSLGAILYEMLSGRRAFRGDSAADTMSAVLREDPQDLSLITRAIPPALDRAVRHCLEKSPEQRFQSARDLAYDLESLSTLGSTAGHAALHKRPWQRMIIPLVVALAALGMLAAWRTGLRVTWKQPDPWERRSFLQLTYAPGKELQPSLSPDGKTIVYVSSQSGNPDIYLQRVDGRNVLNLTKDSTFADVMPAFSPDGSLISLRSGRDGGGIFVMGATGESVRRVTDFGYNPSWSPDGTELVVATEGVTMTPGARATRSQLWIVNVKSGAKRLLVKGDAVQPSWSPHGDRIAYWGLVGASGQRDLWTVSAHAQDAEKTTVAVTDDASLDWNPVWSPDGSWLFFGSDRGGAMNLWRIRIEERSGKPRGPAEAVTVPSRFAGGFSMAASGAIAFAGLEPTNAIMRLELDPITMQPHGSPQRIFGGSLLVNSFDISPDNQWLVLSNVERQQDLYTLRSDGSDLRQLTNDPEKDRGPSWSPDGTMVWFYSQRPEKRYEIWSIRTDGSDMEQLSSTTGSPIWYPRISPDQKYIAAYCDKGAVLFLRAKRGSFDLLPNPSPELHFASPFWAGGESLVGGIEGLDGRRLPGIYRFDITTRKYDRLLEKGGMPVPTADGRFVIFNEGTRLNTLDVATGAVRQLPMEGDEDDHVTISANRRSLYSILDTTEGDIWILTPEK
ncbi:MAG TPA: protein kinase, partial [Thermoanaerobaculia bacterium]|nr:protein kinase [Thermoanaerobaculia bacterium]